MIDRRLRLAVLIVALCATLSMALAKIIPIPIGAELAGLLLIAHFIACARLPRTPRTLAGAALFAMISAAAALTGGFGSGVPSALALIAVSLLIAQILWSETPRELAVTTALAIALLILAIGLAPTATLAVPLLLAWPAAIAVAVLVRGAAVNPHLAQVFTAKIESGRARRPALGAVALVTAISVVTAILSVLLAPIPEGGPSRSLPRIPGVSNPADRGLTGYTGSDLDLRVRGDLPQVAVAQIPPDAPELWRMAILTRYDGSSWRGQTGTPRALVGQALPSGDRRVPVAEVLPDATLANSPKTGTELALPVRRLAGAPPSVLAPAGLLAVEVPAGLVDLGSGRLGFGQNNPPRYTVVLAPNRPSTRQAVPVAATDPAEKLWTDLPPGITDRTKDLARTLSAERTDRRAVAERISRYVQGAAKYNLKSAVPPAGQDAVDHFLFDAREGFCEQFASAMVVLLRILGVPSRIATGFRASPPGPDGQRIIRGTDAHAWVEVYFPGTGWQSWDPTAAADTAPTRWSPAAWVRSLLADPGRRYRAAAAVAACAVLAAGIALARRRRPTAPVVAPAAPRHPAWILLSAVSRLQRSIPRASPGLPPAETLQEMAAQVPQLPPDAVDVAQRANYAGKLPSAQELDTAAQDFYRAWQGISGGK